MAGHNAWWSGSMGRRIFNIIPRSPPTNSGSCSSCTPPACRCPGHTPSINPARCFRRLISSSITSRARRNSLLPIYPTSSASSPRSWPGSTRSTARTWICRFCPDSSKFTPTACGYDAPAWMKRSAKDDLGDVGRRLALAARKCGGLAPRRLLAGQYSLAGGAAGGRPRLGGRADRRPPGGYRQ